jgi:hypothetical protein
VVERHRVQPAGVGVDARVLGMAGDAVVPRAAVNALLRGDPLGDRLVAVEALLRRDPFPRLVALLAVFEAFEPGMGFREWAGRDEGAETLRRGRSGETQQRQQRESRRWRKVPSDRAWMRIAQTRPLSQRCTE